MADALVHEQLDNTARDMIIASLQKLSLRSVVGNLVSMIMIHIEAAFRRISETSQNFFSFLFLSVSGSCSYGAQ